MTAPGRLLPFMTDSCRPATDRLIGVPFFAQPSTSRPQHWSNLALGVRCTHDYPHPTLLPRPPAPARFPSRDRQTADHPGPGWRLHGPGARPADPHPRTPLRAGRGASGRVFPGTDQRRTYRQPRGERHSRQGLRRPQPCREQGLYLPGLAAGGVQLQDRFARVSHPGVSKAELAFLRGVPDKATRFLAELLAAPPYALAATEITALVSASVLDNLASPTLNLNSLYQHFSAQPMLYRQLQQAVADFMSALQQQASQAGLGDAFFVHYAPNLGQDTQGHERLKYSDGDDAGSTDFQFMLKGAIKEVGVLLILNHYYQQRTGHYPLGEHFNARQAPRDQDALLQRAREHFDPALMPRILGVGDTVTSNTRTLDGRPRMRGI